MGRLEGAIKRDGDFGACWARVFELYGNLSVSSLIEPSVRSTDKVSRSGNVLDLRAFKSSSSLLNLAEKSLK